MKIGIGNDHAAVEMKMQIIKNCEAAKKAYDEAGKKYLPFGSKVAVLIHIPFGVIGIGIKAVLNVA